MVTRHAGIAALSLFAGLVLAGQGMTLTPKAKRAPEFPSSDVSRWVGDPQRLERLRGRVVLLDVWTFG